MGLTFKATGSNAADSSEPIKKNSPNDKIIALAGNPNVGKSTVFNCLTGMHQHTGNWAGKTVATANGKYTYNGTDYILVDLPGTYSLFTHSGEEEISGEFICFNKPDAVIAVCDARCLERNLNLVLQTLAITSNVVLCVNLVDEAIKRKTQVDFSLLEDILGIPVVAASAARREGMAELKAAVEKVIAAPPTKKYEMNYGEKIEQYINEISQHFSANIPQKRLISLKILDCDEKFITHAEDYLHCEIDKNILNYAHSLHTLMPELSAQIAAQTVIQAEQIAKSVVKTDKNSTNRDRRIDKILSGKKFGIPIMILMLFFILWITISGANYPSELLSKFLFSFEDNLLRLFNSLKVPSFLSEPIVFGVYRVLAWVISVMLPPMAIFFPLFTILEDLGYLPRVAFNLDKYFKRACTCGKQCLTMCMGLGCNASGIVGCRIIDSPRERLIAIITNSFIPCNGRFPTLIAVITMFFVCGKNGFASTALSTAMLTMVIILGILATFFVSWLLSKTILKGVPSSFTLELPPYRRPRIIQVIVRSIFDRTLFVLARAVTVAAPAGLIIWLMANIHINGVTLLCHTAEFLNPFAYMLGLDGVILLAFILGFPANEIVMPIIIMAYMSNGVLVELNDLSLLRELLVSNGWTPVTAICTMIFSLMHWPCSTTCLTVKKETHSIKWTLASFFIPTIIGMSICFLIAGTARILGF